MGSLNIYFVSLGCDKNLVDSEIMLGILKERGFKLTDSPEDADIIVVNTCSFILDAQEESVETLLEMAEYRKSGKCRALIVAGCLAQRYKYDITEEISEVDAVIGTASYQHIAEVVDEILSGDDTVKAAKGVFDDLSLMPQVEVARVANICSYSSYLKISEGCDKHCTYCIIPKLRGPYRSYPMEYLISQAEHLAANGTKELNIVAQETTVYGKDIYGRKMLHELLERLCAIDGIEWIRLLYCYPEEIYDELIDVMEKQPKICHYIDMPIQHCSDRILRLMGRRTSKAEITGIVEKLRSRIPNIALRTTLISGFPSESEEEHEELLEFVKDMEFDRLGDFAYSQEDGTPAAEMEEQISEDVKIKRQQEIMKLQNDISIKKSSLSENKVIPVIIDGFIPEDGVYVGRSAKDAPDIDGAVYVNADRELMSGDIVSVYITEASGYDMIGELYD